MAGFFIELFPLKLSDYVACLHPSSLGLCKVSQAEFFRIR
jgi:hypothetical protein